MVIKFPPSDTSTLVSITRAEYAQRAEQANEAFLLSTAATHEKVKTLAYLDGEWYLISDSLLKSREAK